MNSRLSAQCSAPSNNYTSNQIATSSNHQESKSRRRKPQKEKIHFLPEKSVYISPLPKTSSKQELTEFLLTFGKIRKQAFDLNSVLVEFHDSKPIYQLTRQSTWFVSNEKIYVRKIRNDDSSFDKDQKGGKTEEEDLISYDRIKSVIENEVTFDSQLTALLNTIQLSDFELITRYNIICTHLDEIFRSIFPECQTYRFGSTIAGLSFKESDLDIYMYVGKAGLPPHLHGPDIPPHILTLTIFRKVKKIMYSMRSVFANIISIPKAKTPIIKFRYVPTNVSCDISFKNSLGIYKSDFLRYCATRDPRIRPLMLLIKYWARHFGISGIGKISSYGLVCLIIFYLQQDFVGLLPSLLVLQRTCSPQIVNGWQVNFDENTVIPAITNNNNIAVLLHNFFSFYATFCFNSCVMCLLDGKIYSTADFAQIDKLPDYMERYKSCIMENSAKKLDLQKPMCLQDPIELNQNTAAVTSDRALVAFKHCCAFGAEICVAASENNYENLLTMLFTTVPPELMTTKKKRKKFKTHISAGRFLLAGLPKNFEECTDILDKEQYKKNNWYFLTFNLIRDIFEMVFKLQVEVLLDQETKQQKVEVLSDVHTQSHEKITLHCTGNKCVWYNRKKNNKTFLDIQLSLLEKEAITSDKVMEQLSENEAANNIKLDFICVLSKAANTVAAILTLHDENSQHHIFRQFECFVNSWIPKIIEKTFIHMLQFQKTYDQLYDHYKK